MLATLDVDKELDTALETQKDDLEARLEKSTKKYPALYWALNYHVNTRGERMVFNDLDYLLQLYKDIGKHPRMCVEKSVQCGISELFIVQSHIEAGELGLTVMYVLPKYEIRNRFVNNRIYKLHKRVSMYGLLIRQAEAMVHRTSLMHFGKGTLAYVGSNVADEFIEIPVDSAFVDEKDRCNLSNLLMLPDRLTASPYKYEREISNPTIEGFGIDERYQESSQGHWEIECQSCGKWFTPDFWKHVVRQIGHNQFEARDVDYVPGEMVDARLIHDCGAPVNRLASGRWTHEYPKRDWKGYRISKVFSKFVTLDDLIDKHGKAVGNDLKMQLFYNSDLGLPFSSKGAKFTREMLLECCRPYQWPVKKMAPKNVRVMGVDVGDILYVVMRERIRHKGGISMRLVMARSVKGFQALADIITEWQPKRVVIDAAPERHAVSGLKAKFSFVWSMKFQETAPEIHKNKSDREASINRTSLIDTLRQLYDDQDLWLPMEAEFIDNGDFFKHLMASTRILEVDEEKPDKARFVWVHTKPDHYMFADAYCIAASMLMPRLDIFEYYSDEAKTMQKRIARKVIKSGETVEEKVKIQDMQNVTPEIFKAELQRRYSEPKGVKPTVDFNEIWATVDDLLTTQGYADLFLVSKLTGEKEEDVLNVFKIHHLTETVIKGQYIK